MIKRWAIPILVLLIVVIGGWLLWSQVSADKNVLRLHDHAYQLAILRSEDELARGLSGTPSLPENQAVLFVFSGDIKWGIWMKDMNYPIDILWLDNGKKIVHTVKNALPSSYPKTIFRPSTNSRYVIELPSGTIDKTGIKKGDVLSLPSGV